jgi:hypothetical protein
MIWPSVSLHVWLRGSSLDLAPGAALSPGPEIGEACTLLRLPVRKDVLMVRIIDWKTEAEAHQSREPERPWTVQAVTNVSVCIYTSLPFREQLSDLA